MSRTDLDLDLLRRVADVLEPFSKAWGLKPREAYTDLRALISRLDEPQDREAGVTGELPPLARPLPMPPYEYQAAPAPQAVDAETARVIGEIAAERRRQVEAEGWTAEHDDQHRAGQLAAAAGCYALNATPYQNWDHCWPWDFTWWKPKDSRRDLIKAAALIVAEIERLDRAALRAKTEEPS